MASAAEPVKSPTPTLNSDGTVLPFPDRFHAAVQFVVNPVEGAAQIKDETRLVLYALHQQAVVGPCKEPKPWGWNVVESAKWNSWSQLKDMSPVEAMRLYVKVLEEEVQPDWWVLSRSADLQKKCGQRAQSGVRQKGLRDSAVAGEWAAVDAGGAKRPAPRYEHTVALLRRTLYLVGGNCGGRYLNDVWTLDLESLNWQQISTTAAPGNADKAGTSAEPSGKEDEALLQPALPPLAGHALVPWGTSLLCIGGHTKGWQSKDPGQRMVVRALDTVSREWTVLQPSGDLPPNRGSHTATLIGNRIFVFGGEDVARRGVSDLYVLDLATLAWSTPEWQGGPPSRSAHVAAAVDDRFLLVFGGGSVARCYNDLWVLDTQQGVWSNPQPEGIPPSPRAGHAGGVLGGQWYVTGGGNNSSGCNDMLALDLAGLGGTPLVGTPSLRWEAVTTVEPRASIASEGLSLTSLPEMGLLLAFGGYNGKYHSTVQVFRPDAGFKKAAQVAQSAATPGPAAPARKSQKPVEPLMGKRPSAEIAAAAVASSSGGVPAEQPLANGHAPPSGQAKGLSAEAQGRLASLEAVARDAQASREAMLSEMVLMRKQLNHALEAKAAVDKELEEAQAQLSTEQNKVFQLEVQLAEATQKLQLTAELEKEVNHYRKMIKEAEANKSKGGLWNYISGA